MTEADPNALAEFYGNEDFMEIFCVFPFMVDFMMWSGYFDDNGHVHTFGLPPVISNMVVSMQFDEREEEDADGEANTVCFNKKERSSAPMLYLGIHCGRWSRTSGMLPGKMVRSRSTIMGRSGRALFYQIDLPDARATSSGPRSST